MIQILPQSELSLGNGALKIFVKLAIKFLPWNTRYCPQKDIKL